MRATRPLVTSYRLQRALGQKWRSGENRAHWLDHALTHHTCEGSTACHLAKRRLRNPAACAEAKFVEDVKSLFRVLVRHSHEKCRSYSANVLQVMFLPLPIFWSLYDQVNGHSFFKSF